MHLQFERHLGAYKGFDSALRVPTQGSGVSIVGNLESIAKDVSFRHLLALIFVSREFNVK